MLLHMCTCRGMLGCDCLVQTDLYWSLEHPEENDDRTPHMQCYWPLGQQLQCPLPRVYVVVTEMLPVSMSCPQAG